MELTGGCVAAGHVTIASLDDPTPLAPQKAIWLETKLPWVTLDKSLSSFPISRTARNQYYLAVGRYAESLSYKAS